MIDRLARSRYPNFHLILTLVLFLNVFINSSFAQSIEDKVTVHKLNNGMTFVFLERHKVPTFAAVYGFKFGGVDEVTGLTGIAHLLEHMAFKGTTRIGTKDYAKEKPIMEKINKLGDEWSKELMKGEFADKQKIEKIKEEMKRLESEQKDYLTHLEIVDLYREGGGIQVNASTGSDATRFTAALPANQLELWCLIESERIKDPVFREFYTERSVVQQERKQVIGGRPIMKFMEVFKATAFVAHPYRNPVIGWESDIETVTLEEVMDFREKYYVPNNCVAALVGDIYPEKAIPLVEKYFGDIPRGPDVPEVRTIEPKQLGEIKFVMEAKGQPALRIGYHKPTTPHKDAYAMFVIMQVLTGGRTSRLQKDFVEERKLATQIWCAWSFGGQRYDNLFLFQGAPKAPHTHEELEKAIDEHIEKLKTEPVKDRELQKIMNAIEFQKATSLSNNFALAGRLMSSQLLRGDWRVGFQLEDRILEVTPEDIMRVSKKYFTKENRTVGYLVKKKQEKKKKGKKIGGLK